MGEGEVLRLPRAVEIPQSLRIFVGERFRSAEDLRGSPALEAELRRRCADLEAALSDLDSGLGVALAAYALHSETLGELLGKVRAGLLDLCSSASGPSPDDIGSRGGGEQRLARSEQIMAEELPALAKEVARVETVRAYAETALKLDSLIGDVEDAVSSSMTGNIKLSPSVAEEMYLTAISSLRSTEDILASITRSRPQWTRLVSAVDDRVDRALAILRPQAIADHRSLLVSLGWPPPLSSSNIANASAGKAVTSGNPLLTMKGDLKSRYCESFVALCNLQEFQRRRKSRQLEGHNLEVALHQPLWAIEELVNPFTLASQRYFSKWIEKPDFIFALVYKIVRDFVDSMDEILQPLVDKAKLVGCSCREEWISSMVTSLSTYLAKEVFPKYIGLLEEESSTGLPSHARISWLHLVDQMIMFDKRIQSLITNSGFPISVREDENLQRLSSLCVFCDRPDWLEVWAEMELIDTLDKLKPELENEQNWKTKIQGTSLLSGQEDYKSPAVSGDVLHRLSTLVDRCRPLPSTPLRARFIRLAGAPIVRAYLDILLHRCQEAEGLTALVDDDALIKVCNCINGARYCESVLLEWCDDIFFLEMLSKSCEDVADRENCIFQEEIGSLKGLRMEWLEKISTVVLRGFDAECRDYLKNRKQWQEKADGWNVSKAFIGALDYLQGKICKLEVELNEVDFVGLWRSLANGIDQLLFSGILRGNTKFYDGGVERFGGDLAVLFSVFSSWCLRPEGFFPRVSEGLRLLKMDEKELKDGLMKVTGSWLRQKGVRHLTVSEAEKIIKNRMFVE